VLLDDAGDCARGAEDVAEQRGQADAPQRVPERVGRRWQGCGRVGVVYCGDERAVVVGSRAAADAAGEGHPGGGHTATALRRREADVEVGVEERVPGWEEGEVLEAMS
jgi:hypothetical protein